VNKDIEAKQVPVKSLDMTAAIIWLPDYLVFTMSIYMPGGDA
jgi:hypothetical protein